MAPGEQAAERESGVTFLPMLTPRFLQSSVKDALQARAQLVSGRHHHPERSFQQLLLVCYERALVLS
jgi:hypothetical protein